MTEFRAALAGDDGTLREAVEAAGGTVVAADPDAVVTLGERALVEAVLGNPPAPVLPIDAGDGRHAVNRVDAEPALAALAAGRGRTESRATLSVTVDGDRRARAVLDATLMTVEPARISEYAVGEGDDGEPVARVRSDGVVVATPAGSSGYARAAGGSVLTPGTGLSVVPVSPFTTTADTWVLADEAVVRVERDDCDVQLIVDGETAGVVPPKADIRIAVDGRVPFLRVPPSAVPARPRR